MNWVRLPTVPLTLGLCEWHAAGLQNRRQEGSIPSRPAPALLRHDGGSHKAAGWVRFPWEPLRVCGWNGRRSRLKSGRPHRTCGFDSHQTHPCPCQCVWAQAFEARRLGSIPSWGAPPRRWNATALLRLVLRVRFSPGRSRAVRLPVRTRGFHPRQGGFDSRTAYLCGTLAARLATGVASRRQGPG